MFNPLKILKASFQSVVKKIMDAHGHMHAEAGSPNGGRFVSHTSQSIPAIHLQNREGNHDKFYKIAVHGKHVIRHWGRNGREGFYDVKSYPSERAAKLAAATVHQAKVGRGYSRVEGEHHLTGNLNSMLPEADHIRPPAPAPVNHYEGHPLANHPAIADPTHDLDKASAHMNLYAMVRNLRSAQDRYHLSGGDHGHVENAHDDVTRAERDVKPTIAAKIRALANEHHNALNPPIQPTPPVASTPTAAQTPPTSGAITNGLPTGSPDDPHGLRHLDTPSKIKNAVYAAHHAFYSIPVVSTADSPEKRAAAERSVAIHDHARANGITADEHAQLHTMAREHAAAGTFKLPFKGRSRSTGGLPQAAISAASQQQRPASVQPSPAPVQETPPPVQQNPVAAPSPAPVPTQQSPATGQASSANDDPHGLRALDTPSKIRNAVYRASHTFHSLSHDDHTGLTQQAQTVAAIATHALANGVSQEHINSLAGQGKSDAETGRFQLPHRNRNLRTGGGLQNSLAATPASQRTASPEQAQSGATHAGVPEAIHAPAQQLPEPPASVTVPADPVPATPAQEQAPNLNLGRVLRQGRQPAAPRADHLQLPANFDPVTHNPANSGASALARAQDYIHGHVKLVLRNAARGYDVDPNRITGAGFYRRGLDRALQNEGLTGIHGGSILTHARDHARRALEAYRNGTLQVNRYGEPLSASASTPSVTPTPEVAHVSSIPSIPATPSNPAMPTQGTLPSLVHTPPPPPKGATPKQIAIQNLTNAAIQRGRNVAQYEHDNGFSPNGLTSAYRDATRNRVAEAKQAVIAAGLSQREADTIERSTIDVGTSQRKAELRIPTIARNNLLAAATARGEHEGYHGNTASAPAHIHETVATTHAAAIAALGAAAADRLLAESHAQGVRQGKEKRQAEHRQEISNITDAVQTTAREWGRLSATGQSIPLSSQAAHQTNMSRLNQLMQSSGANSHADALHAAAHAEGLKAGQNTLKERLRRASFAIGQHAAKNTEPSAAERLESEQAHAVARQHLGTQAANTVSVQAHEAGRQDILDPGMTVEKVKQHMTDLGIGHQATPDFCANWVRKMPKASPTEVIKAFLGDDMNDKRNVSKLSLYCNASKFSMSGNNLKSHGATIEDLSRSFDFNHRVVEHGFLRLVEGDRGGSCVKQIFQKCFGSGEEGKPSLYERMGMDKAHVHGALEGGGYVWPGFGFYYDSPAAASRHLSDTKRYFDESKKPDFANGRHTDFEHFKAVCDRKGVIFPNADGTSSRRPPTEAEHQAYMSEHNNITTLLTQSRNMKTGYALCKLKTPIMDAVHADFIKGNRYVKKRPTLIKACQMGRADFYGTIDMKNPDHIAVVRKGLFKAGG